MKLADLLSATRCLLIDFDGPICSVFAGHPAAKVADELRTVIRRHFDDQPPAATATLGSDPLQILTTVASLDDEQLTREVADACRDAEITATGTAALTAGAMEVLQAAHDTGRRVGIVSNNATEAISAYLQNRNLTHLVAGIAARYNGMDPCLLKPHPFLLERGLHTMNATPATTAFIGDSVTDIAAGRAAGIPTIGYANKPGKLQRLTNAGADIVIDSMHQLTQALYKTEARTAR